ncbi:MAG: T9SS type A sorting domain-containing protein [Candidatus Marinimicrobia bacterium]|nr:T9SS type A sorting domain-containing protein [Candidatus Neomarinimicrobiota bacterium]MBL7023657.1 T9SS type A sorting domain-containing protein [Candidatus Neomarinimicrobiota bacterium]MBL7109879.1 T9SS type A sorting domain-containing protein [Candidatus Neomarinimicrobiota bacterium]
MRKSITLITILFLLPIFILASNNVNLEQNKVKISLSAKDYNLPNWQYLSSDRSLADMFGVASTAPVSAGEMIVHADVPDSVLEDGPFNAFLFSGNGLDSDWANDTAYLMGTPGYENTFSATVSTPVSGPFNIGVQAVMTTDTGEVVITQAPLNANESFPAPYYLSICDESLGDEETGNSNLDIEDVSISISDNKIYGKMTNAPGAGYPVDDGFFGPWYLYTIGFVNPDDTDSTLYGMGYADAGFGTLYTGLWKFQDGGDPVFISNIDHTINGDELHMACNLSDVVNDPDFGVWPNEFESFGVSGLTMKVTTSEQLIGDVTDGVGLNPDIQRFVIGENTAPVIVDHGFNILSEADGMFAVEFYCEYQDDDNHFPLYPWLYMDGAETGLDMISYDHTYYDGSVFTTQISLEAGDHFYNLSFNDGLNWATTSTIPFTLGSQESTISIPMLSGWNWFSINLENDDLTLNTVLTTLGADASLIKNQTGFATYYADFGWYGLDAIDVKSMYMIQMLADGSLEFEGTPVDYLNTPILLANGWNWISYLPQESNDLNGALANIGSNGTFLKNQNSFANYYDGFGWYSGNGMDNMEAGGGYMLQVIADAELIYGEPVGFLKFETEVMDLHWSVNPHQFEHNMAVTISVENMNQSDILGAFVGGDVRGVATPSYFPLTDSYTINMMVYGYESENISFKIFNQKTGIELEIKEKLTFIQDGIIGNDIEPVFLKSVSEEAEDFLLASAYPNPFNPMTTLSYDLVQDTEIEIKIFDITGRQVAEILQTNHKQSPGHYEIIWNANEYSSGIYFVIFETENAITTQKLVLMK